MTRPHVTIVCRTCSLRTVTVSFCRDNPEAGELAGARFVALLVALRRGWIADGSLLGYCPPCRARVIGERREAVRS